MILVLDFAELGLPVAGDKRSRTGGARSVLADATRRGIWSANLLVQCGSMQCEYSKHQTCLFRQANGPMRGICFYRRVEDLEVAVLPPCS